MTAATTTRAKRPRAKTPIREFIFIDELMQRLGVGHPCIWRWMVAGEFPHAVQFGGRSAWYRDEVDQWIQSRPRKQYKVRAGK